MRCKTAQKYSSQFLDGDLSPQTLSAIRGHLRLCDSCRSVFQQERALCSAMTGLDGEPEAPDVLSRVLHAQAEAEKGDSHRFWRDRYLRLAAPVGLGMVAVAVVVFFLWRPSTPPTVSKPTIAILSPETAGEMSGIGIVEAKMQSRERLVRSLAAMAADLGHSDLELEEMTGFAQGGAILKMANSLIPGATDR